MVTRDGALLPRWTPSSDLDDNALARHPEHGRGSANTNGGPPLNIEAWKLRVR